MGTCCPDRYSPPDLLGVGLVMVLRLLADWKVWLFNIGMVERISEQVVVGMFSCWVEK